MLYLLLLALNFLSINAASSTTTTTATGDESKALVIQALEPFRILYNDTPQLLFRSLKELCTEFVQQHHENHHCSLELCRAKLPTDLLELLPSWRRIRFASENNEHFLDASSLIPRNWIFYKGSAQTTLSDAIANGKYRHLQGLEILDLVEDQDVDEHNCKPLANRHTTIKDYQGKKACDRLLINCQTTGLRLILSAHNYICNRDCSKTLAVDSSYIKIWDHIAGEASEVTCDIYNRLKRQMLTLGNYVLITSRDNQSIIVLDNNNFELLATLPGISAENWITKISLTPKGKLCIARDNTVQVFNKKLKIKYLIISGLPKINSIISCGPHLLSCDGVTVDVWNLNNRTHQGSFIHEGDVTITRRIIPSPNGKFFVVFNKNQLFIWDNQTLRLLRTINFRKLLPEGSYFMMYDVKISPDNTSIIPLSFGHFAVIQQASIDE